MEVANLQEIFDRLVKQSKDGATFGVTFTDAKGVEFLIIPVKMIVGYETFADGTKVLVRRSPLAGLDLAHGD